jgi:hypothetical protein
MLESVKSGLLRLCGDCTYLDQQLANPGDLRTLPRSLPLLRADEHPVVMDAVRLRRATMLASAAPVPIE